MADRRYSLKAHPRVEKDLRKVPSALLPKVLSAIQGLADDPRPRGSLKLTAREGHRLRVGRFRILYLVDDKSATVTVTDVRARPEAYR